MTRIPVLADPETITTKKADARGRVNLGSDYGDREVTVAVLDVQPDDADALESDFRRPCPECDGVMVVMDNWQAWECQRCDHTMSLQRPPGADG